MSDSPDRLINERYAVVRLLGEGGMGSVYLARDTYQGGRPIALKILRSEGLDSESIERFKSEFRSMARLRHPNLAEVYDFGMVRGDGRYFLTMEYVKGEDLGRQSRSDLVERFDSLAVQCLRALDYIHSRGLLHNDVKPHNIMIQPPFQVRLLDLGLAQGQAEAARPGVSGTLHYVAPERFGDQKVDARSDLYSLGVVLYEVLTGSLPYQGADAGQVIGAILRGDARSPRTLNPAVAERLERFTLSLMGRSPGSRPAAAAVALDLLNSGRAEPLRIDTPETYASFVTSGRFVGRDQDLDRLMKHATEHAQNADGDESLPRLILLSGPGGIGKSRLLRELKHRLQLAGIRNLTGRCYQDGGVPFHPFVEVLRQLPRPAEMPDELRSVVHQLVPPESTGAPAPPDASKPAEPIGKREFIRAVADSLARLAEGTRGVVFLEDLHWSDAPGVDLLEHLALRPDRGPWLYIGSLRDEEARSAPIAALLKRLSASTRCLRIPLAPLNAEQVTEFLASMVPFGERPEGLARILAERTEGNPLYLEEIMKVLAEEGTLRRHGGSWLAESRTLEAIRLPPSLASAVAQRVSALPAGDRHVAEVLAVFNRPVDVDSLAPASGLTPEQVEEAIEALDRLRLVHLETLGDGRSVVDLAHNRLREAIYAAIPADRRRALHLAVGLAIEAAHSSSIATVVEELAHHFSAAADRERAADYCLRAAGKADMLFYPQRQLQLFVRALEFLPESDSARRLPTLSEMSATQSNDMRDHEGALRTARLLRDESRKAEDKLHEAIAHREMAWCQGFMGDARSGLENARRSLALLRSIGNRDQEGWCLNTLGAIHATHGDHAQAIEYFNQARSIFESAGEIRGMVNVINNAGLNYLGMGEAEKATQFMEKGLEIARKHAMSSRYNRGLPNMGMARYETGDVPGAIRVLEEALVWGREHFYPEVTVQCLENLSGILAHLGLFDRALSMLEEERTMMREAGDRAGLLIVHDYIGNLNRNLGRLTAAKQEHREGLELARKLDSKIQEGYLLASLAADLVQEGSLRAAEDSAREALSVGRGLSHERIRCLALCALARASAHRGDRRGLATVLRALARVDARYLRYHDRLLVNLTLAHCALAAGRPSDAEREARAGLVAAERAGLREFQWRLNVLMGDSLTAKGLPDGASGFYNAARELIRQTASEIQDPAMRKDYENDETRRTAIAQATGAEGVPMVSEAPAGAAKGDPVKMLTTIYQITQIINSILDLKELLSKVMDQAIDLVGAERGLIFLYRSETDDMEMVVARNMEHQTIKDATEYSRSILKEAGHGRAILSHDAATDERFKEFRSVAAYNIRSLLCVPLRLKSRIIGTVYVDTRKPGVIFTEDDLRFLEAFANQAAIAIENARLYEQARQENQYLKAAVQERYGYENIIGRSPKMRDVFTLLSRVASSQLPVMIRGESGTGKELVARAIHHNSPRRDRKFFTENCAALPDTLLESELFGHAKGAFTGADTTRRGLFEMADGGTLFLDEVGDMSMPMQSKLLRVLQDGEFRPVGSETARQVDVRVISATNRDLEAMIKQKAFREDLYFRLKVITVKLPSLSERRDDIPLLVDHFLGRIAQENKSPKLRVDRDLITVLTRYDWPGNVRELENQVYRLALFASGDALTLQDAQADVEFFGKVTLPGTRGVDTGITRDDLQRALNQSNGNRDEAARILGVSRATFFRKLKQFQIGSKRPRLVRPPHTA